MLNDQGFQNKTYDDILTDLQAKAIEIFGENAHVDSGSVLGTILQVVAWSMSLIYDLIERVYFSSFVNTATGTSLDRLGANYNVSRNPASESQVTLKFTGQVGYVIEEGTLFETEDGTDFFTVEDIVLTQAYTTDGTGASVAQSDGDGNLIGAGSGLAVSVDSEADTNVQPGTITVQSEPAEELLTVINDDVAGGGADIETDTSYRARIKSSMNATPGPPVSGIETAVGNVSGVRQVQVIENNTMETDSYGNPPKCIHIYVLGGAAADVGQAISNSIAAGIQTVGTEQVTATDIGSHSRIINFDFTKQVQLYCQLSLTLDDTFDRDEGVEDIKNDLMDYVNGLRMGDIIRYSYFFKEIYATTGVTVADVKIGIDPSKLNTSDIQLDPLQSVNLDATNIEVTTIG